MPETPAIYPAWRRLVITYGVGVAGIQVFDTRLVAIMQTHGIERILTFNGSDFTTYGVQIIDPMQVQVEAKEQ